MVTTKLNNYSSSPIMGDAIIPMKPKPLKACFSYAAYAKNLICLLHSLSIPIETGLSEPEFSTFENLFNFKFPPDLRAILSEGLPVGQGFPNWRSSSLQQLKILTSLPVLGICKEVSKNGFWVESWGEKPVDRDEAAESAKGFLKDAPFLVPIYRDFYVPSSPCASGNPVFYVHGVEIRVFSSDIAGFFQGAEFSRLSEMFKAPAWAAKEARRIEFWSEMAERGLPVKTIMKDNLGNKWWSGDELEDCLEEVMKRLINGGWKEDDVREMMMMMDGCDDVSDCSCGLGQPLDRESAGSDLSATRNTEYVVDLFECRHAENQGKNIDIVVDCDDSFFLL